MKFYNPKGEEIGSKEDFIRLYSNIYYVLVGKENAEIESVIESIYGKGIQAGEEDFIKFLRWKVGDKKKDKDTITTVRGHGINADKIIHIGTV